MKEDVANQRARRNGSGPRYSIIPAAFCLDPRPGIWHFRVLNLLGRHTDKHGWCVRSQAEMAKDIATTRETVNRTIRDLCEWGYVQKTDQGENKKSVIYYRVVMDPPELPEACDHSITCDDSITGGCDDSDHRGVTTAITGGVIAAITPITTPLQRPSNNDQEARERASDEGARATPAKKLPTTSITLQAGETAFAAWLEHLHKKGLSTMAGDARDAGYIEVPRRWPNDDDMPIRPPKPQRSELSDVSKRMVGESAK